jgi:hypothetical protein
MRFFLIVFCFINTLIGFSQINNNIDGVNEFIGKQKNIKLFDGPYQIDSVNYFLIGTISKDTFYFFYKYKNGAFRLNDTYEYQGVDDLNKKLSFYHINNEVEVNNTIFEKVDEWAYRDQLILIEHKENPDKFVKEKVIKVPYAKRVGGKWIYLNSPRIIWLDKNGKEIKRA